MRTPRVVSTSIFLLLVSTLAVAQDQRANLATLRAARSAALQVYCDADGDIGNAERAALAPTLLKAEAQRYGLHLEFWKSQPNADPNLVAQLTARKQAYEQATNDTKSATTILDQECGATSADGSKPPAASGPEKAAQDPSNTGAKAGDDARAVLQRWARIRPGLTIEQVSSLISKHQTDVKLPSDIQQLEDVDKDMLLSDALRVTDPNTATGTSSTQGKKKASGQTTPANATQLPADPKANPAQQPAPASGLQGNSNPVTATTPPSSDANSKGPLAQLYGLLGGTYGRAIIGYEQAGASAAPFTQNFFGNMYISDGLDWHRPSSYDPELGADYQNSNGRCLDNKEEVQKLRNTGINLPTCEQAHISRLLGPRPRIFGDIRITSIPQQDVASAGGSSIGNFVTNFPSTFKNLQVNQVARGVELLSGMEYRLHASEASRVNQARDSRSRTVIATFFEAGFTTPFTPRNTVQTFLVPPTGTNSTFYSLYPAAAGKKYIAFTSADRDRFFREYYVGIRLRRHYFDAYDESTVASPSVFDVAWGGNEAVTGGRIHGAVIRLDGFAHLPGKFGEYMFVYGTAMLKPTRSKITTPLLLNATGSSDQVDLTAPDTYIAVLPQTDRDYYRIGIGVDLTKIFSIGTPKAQK